ncbi:hypothetical protein A3B35_00090 [Candidatus Kaiserbacteria bacterium RIFCSPLOWO2_01_FULL_54_24]|uniref:Uncharacterized protein n=1 Tax=Candidatus Kaiserbacteria bacterium RIFCSPLOWO2_01_FULL_54_24 TaxID=1798515 RepID=A0A1F6ETU7_9BACT|nr:MAG: hypothetical protein A3B35_00090 [Candidatus Kaiserbacteria bacterium RIFCSPLOWO2_01_FULL_54_24]
MDTSLSFEVVSLLLLIQLKASMGVCDAAVSRSATAREAALPQQRETATAARTYPSSEAGVDN